MKFDIHELGDSAGLIHICMEGDSLSWDFPMGSQYDLCAVFDRREGKNLQELQMAEIHPFLFHKRLNTSCHFSRDIYNKGFLLFPASIKNGTLDVGNQLHAQNAILPDNDREIRVRTVSFVKKLFFFEKLKTVKEYAFRESDLPKVTDRAATFIYYRISDGSNTTVYRLPVTSDAAQIILSKNEKINFFKDADCLFALSNEENANGK